MVVLLVNPIQSNLFYHSHCRLRHRCLAALKLLQVQPLCCLTNAANLACSGEETVDNRGFPFWWKLIGWFNSHLLNWQSFYLNWWESPERITQLPLPCKIKGYHRDLKMGKFDTNPKIRKLNHQSLQYGLNKKSPYCFNIKTNACWTLIVSPAQTPSLEKVWMLNELGRTINEHLDPWHCAQLCVAGNRFSYCNYWINSHLAVLILFEQTCSSTPAEVQCPASCPGESHQQMMVSGQAWPRCWKKWTTIVSDDRDVKK